MKYSHKSRCTWFVFLVEFHENYVPPRRAVERLGEMNHFPLPVSLYCIYWSHVKLMDDIHYHSHHILFSLDNHVLYVYLSYNNYSIFCSQSRIFCELELALHEGFCNDSANELSCELDTHFRNLHPFSSLLLVVWVEWQEKVLPSLVDNVGLAGNSDHSSFSSFPLRRLRRTYRVERKPSVKSYILMLCPSTSSVCCMVAWLRLD